jgi:hypothetical protein
MEPHSLAAIDRCSYDALKIIMLLLEPQDLMMFSIAVPRVQSTLDDTKFIKTYIEQNTHPRRLRLDSKSLYVKLGGTDVFPIISAFGETRDDYQYWYSVDVDFEYNEEALFEQHNRMILHPEINETFPTDLLAAAEQGRVFVWFMGISVTSRNASSNEYQSLQQREKEVIQEVVDYAVHQYSCKYEDRFKKYPWVRYYCLLYLGENSLTGISEGEMMYQTRLLIHETLTSMKECSSARVTDSTVQ